MDKRLYPIEKALFTEIIEPKITEQYRRVGRAPKISHYDFFCDVLYVLQVSLGEIYQNVMVLGTPFILVLKDGVITVFSGI